MWEWEKSLILGIYLMSFFYTPSIYNIVKHVYRNKMDVLIIIPPTYT